MKQFNLLLLVAFIATTLNAQVKSNDDLKNTRPVTMELGKVDGFLEHLPPDYHTSNNKKYPLLVYLHGTGERGNGSTDLFEIAQVGDPSRRAEENGSLCFTVDGVEHCFIVISPQLNSGQNWTASNQEQFWEYILEKSSYRIDRDRIYLTGHSLGGNGVWEAAYSDFNANNVFAAIAPLSYWTNTSKVCSVADRKIPVWAFCGEWDGKFINQSRTAINMLRNCAVDPEVEIRFTEVPNSGHNITGPTYRVDHSVYNPNLYEWMLTKTKGSSSSAPKAPATPGQLKANALSATVIKLSWDDKSYNEDGFIIKKSTDPGNDFTTAGTVGKNTTSFTDQDLQQSTKYYYKVQAFNDVGKSAFTSQASATTDSYPDEGDGAYITWTNINGAVQKGANLEKTAAYGWGNSGAESTQRISAHEDGWIEMVVEDVSKSDMVFGLSDSNWNDNLASIDYGFELSKYNQAFWIRENSDRQYIGVFSVGDRLRIKRSGNKVVYTRNGNNIATSTSSSQPSLIADVALLNTGSTVFKGRISSSTSSNQEPSDGYITWTNINGAVQQGNTLEKTAVYGWGNSGAESSKAIEANTNGYIEMSIDDVSKTDLVFGLSDENINDNQGSTGYGFELSKYNRAYWKRENGDRKYIGTYNHGDILRIERIGNEILYKNNGNTVSTTQVTSKPRLIADVALLNTGATVFNGRISSGSSESHTTTNVKWVQVHGAVQDGSDLIKTATYGWGNSGAASEQYIAPNSDGWLEMVIQDQSKANLAFGLSENNADDRPESIDYGFETSKYNRAYWKREQSSREYLGTYAENDVLSVERKGSTVFYKKNGQTVATTTNASTAKLIADACMVNTDATVFQARIHSDNSSKRTAEETTKEVDDLAVEQKVLIYPNPVGPQGFLNIALEGYENSTNARFLLYDMNGALVLDEVFDRKSTEITLQHLEQSLYTYQLMLDGQKIESGLIRR